MLKKIITAEVEKNEKLTENIFRLTVYAPEIAKTAKPGQFINIYPIDKSTLLPRPISICDVDGDLITLVIAVVGKGTREFLTFSPSRLIRVSTPLGNGFSYEEIDNKKTIALVGGGVGIPPLLYLAKKLSGYTVNAFLGFKTEVFLLNEFKNICNKVNMATEDASMGFHGNVVQLVRQNPVCDYYFACGPKPMLKTLTQHISSYDIPIQVSLEERMGCGYGACVGCVCKTMQDNQITQKRVCTEGPVFPGSEVIWS